MTGQSPGATASTVGAITVLTAAGSAALTAVLLIVTGQVASAAWLGLLAAVVGVASGAAGATVAVVCDTALRRRGIPGAVRRVVRIVVAGVSGALVTAMLMRTPGMGGDTAAVAALLVLTSVSAALVFDRRLLRPHDSRS